MSIQQSLKIVKWLGILAFVSGVIGAVGAISNAAAGAWKPAWFMFGFELVVVLTGAIIWLIGKGRFRSVAVGLICSASTVFIASAFGFLGAGRVLWGFSLVPHLAARAGLSLLIAAMAANSHLRSEPGSIRLATRGTLLALPVFVVVGVAWIARAQLAAWPSMLLIVLAMLGFVAATGLMAASADCLIRAFSTKAVLTK